ncbi:MAG: peptidoglycan DD-metalloendopeptidase family protein [Bacteroides sp.]|nr:peptidoglycan DD-metalloendopeptidase family protein [Bacteroides sp.]
MEFNWIKKVALGAVALVSLNSYSQDLIVRQAPIDKKVKSVDSLALQKQIKAEQAEYPAYSLYPEWGNKSVSLAGQKLNIPESYKIDLTGFSMPTTNTRVTSPFGPRWRRMHNGIDIKVQIGDTIYAAFDGRIRIVSFERRGYGNYVVIRHDNGLETIYGHLSKHLVKENEYIQSGQPIGLGGNTGRSTGSHLHFETRFIGVAINPAFMFDFPNQDIVADYYTYRRSGGKSTSVSSGTMASAQGGTIRYHKVQKGDTLSKIAKQRGTTIDKLCQLNRISKTTVLRVGQVLRCS